MGKKLAFAALTVIITTVFAGEADVKHECISSRSYRKYAGDWPISREIIDQNNYLKGASWEVIGGISKTSSVCGCINDKTQFGNLNSSDLVVYSGYLKYKGQVLNITTQVHVQTTSTDYNGGYGLAQCTIVCYADQDNIKDFPYRCNMLAKPAQITSVTAEDKLSFKSGGTAYIGNSLEKTWHPVPGLSMAMSRRGLATDTSIRWYSDEYAAEQMGLTLPEEYEGLSRMTIRRVNAGYANSTCYRQLLLQQSIASETAGGAALYCVQWGNMQVYGPEGFAFQMNNMPCSATVKMPYAVLTISAYNKVYPQGYMTIYNGAADSHPEGLKYTTNTISCAIISSNGPVDQQALDVYTAYVNIFDSAVALNNLTRLSLSMSNSIKVRESNVLCSFAKSNTVGNTSNILVASELSAARAVDSLGALQQKSRGIVQPGNNAKPCKIIQHDDPNDAVFVSDLDLGKTVNNTMAYAFAYTFNSKNRLQYDNMASQLAGIQEIHNYGSVLTTCIATVVAGLGVPTFSGVYKIDNIVVKTILLGTLIVVEIVLSCLAGIIEIAEISTANKAVTEYRVSDTSENAYFYSYYSHNMLINLSATMNGKVEYTGFKIALLSLATASACVTILCRWFYKLRYATNIKEAHLYSSSG